jgi:hypothetical protein
MNFSHIPKFKILGCDTSLQAETSASARYPNWYAPLERYVSYEVDQAEHAVEGIGQLEQRMDDFAHV